MKKAVKKLFQLKCWKVVVEQNVVTIIDGEQETSNTAKVGDYIVEGTKGELYVLTQEQKVKRYNEVQGLLSDDFIIIETLPVEIDCEECLQDIEFTASWGEKMIAHSGDYLVYENDVLSYRIEREVFNNTYDLK